MEPGYKFFPSVNVKDLKQCVGLLVQRAWSPASSVGGRKKWLLFFFFFFVISILLVPVNTTGEWCSAAEKTNKFLSYPKSGRSDFSPVIISGILVVIVVLFEYGPCEISSRIHMWTGSAWISEKMSFVRQVLCSVDEVFMTPSNSCSLCTL